MGKTQARRSVPKYTPLTQSEIDASNRNLLACLEAYEKGGDEALDVELRRIHPETPRLNPHFVFAREPLRPEEYMTKEDLLAMEQTNSPSETPNPEPSTSTNS